MLHYFIMSENQYFRVGAGSIIYNDQGQILLLSRTDNPAIWQLQQGGMDQNETMEETLWRELFEETALSSVDIEQIDKYPDWLFYEYALELRPKLKDPNCLGQAHQWYFLKLKSGVEVDLSKAIDKEFDEARWATFDELLSLPDTMKQKVYRELADYFKTNIKK